MAPNRNVRVSLLLTFLIEVSRYLLSRGAFAVFALDVFGDTAAVGVATGINGAAQLLAAFPSGLLADKVGRQAVLTATAAGSIPAAVLTVVSLLLRHPQHRRFAAVAAAQCAWGVYFGAQSPAAEAIFADSVESGNRSRIYTARTALRFCGQAVGPLLVMLVFLIRGDQWTMPELLLAQLVGVGVGVGASICSLFLRERRSLGLASEGLLENPNPNANANAIPIPISNPNPNPNPNPNRNPSPNPNRNPSPNPNPSANPNSNPNRNPSPNPSPNPSRNPYLRESRFLGLASEGLLEAPVAAEAPVPMPQPTPPTSAAGMASTSTFNPIPTFDPKPTFSPDTTFNPDPTFNPTPTFSPNPTCNPDPTFNTNPAFNPNPTFNPTPTFNPDPTFNPTPTLSPNPDHKCCGCGPRWVAPLIVASDVLMMLGSGMTIQFFPLFFKEAVRLGPISVYGVAAGSFASITPAALLSQRCSLWVGRAGVCIAVQTFGVALLALMALWRELRIPSGLLLGMYVVRTACMNSTGGLVASMLNDYVPKKSRARWNILDSVKRASWSGSSAVGGVLVVHMGYEHTFLVTAALQLAGILLLLPLTMIVASEKAARW